MLSRRRFGTLSVFLLLLSLLILGSAAQAFAAPAASFQGSPGWADPTYCFGTGYYADSHAVADLNNDGHPDIVVPMYNSGSDGYLRTYLNDGTGHFTESDVTTISGSEAQMADLDRDGNVDVVASTMWSGHSLTIGRGDGAGGFDTVGHIDLNAGEYNWMLTYYRIADFNGDTIPDILVGTGEYDNARVYLGNGDCTFTQSSLITGLGSSAVNASAGDINRDGKQDFIVANRDSSSIDIRLGDGTGVGFTALPDLPAAAEPWRTALADFDRDGILDLACTYYGSNVVSIWKGDGFGDFTDRVDRTLPFDANDIEVADVNLDGTTDLVVAGATPQSEIAILLNDGAGEFPVTVKPSYGDYWAYGCNTILVADFNGDGRPDLSTTHTNSNWESNVQLLFNTTTIAHTLNPRVSCVYSTGHINDTIATGDFDRDGIADLAVGADAIAETHILKGDGHGAMSEASILPLRSDASLSVADVNRDGKLDLFSFYTDFAATSLGDGSGHFTTWAMGFAPGSWTGTALDEDRDGLPDALAAGYTSPFGQLFQSTGDGGLTMVNVVGGMGPNVQRVVSADLNGDARPDLAAVLNSGSLQLAYGQGDTAFTGGSLPLLGVPSGIAAGDINGDGKTDLVAACAGFGLQPLINDGTGSMSVGMPTASSGVFDVALLDFDLDGQLEAVTAGGDGFVRYFDNDGSGAFTELRAFDPSGTRAMETRIASADFDRDGRPDVAVTCDDSNVYVITDDVTPPYTTALVSPRFPDGTNGWYVTTPTVTLSTNEPATTTYSLNGSPDALYAGGDVTPLIEGTNTITYSSIDTALNPEAPVTTTLKIDTGDPVTTISGLPGAVSDTPVTFSLDAEDPVSGVYRIYYSLDGGTTQTYGTPVEIADDGATTVTYWSVDNAGNIESSESTEVVLDLPKPPVTAPDEYTTDEDHILPEYAPGVLGNDVDPQDGLLTAVLGTGPSHGSLLFNADGSFTYTPELEWHGEDSFTYTAVNAVGASAPETVTITVNDVADPPTDIALSNDTIAEQEPTGTVVGTFSATDVDSTDFTYSIVGGIDADSFEIVGDELRTTRPLDYEMRFEYWITVRVTDESGKTFDKDFAIQLTNINEPPITAPDSYQTDEDTTLTVPAPGVLLNDRDPLIVRLGIRRPAPGMMALLDSDPAHGTLTLAPNGSFTYEPDADWNGEDTFTYTAVNGEGASSPETVTIDVNAVNDAPTALTLSNDTIAENKPAGTVVGTFGTTDADSSDFAYTLVAGDTSAFIVSGDQLRTAESFDHEAKSSYALSVRVTDDHGATFDRDFTISVTNVNETPVAVADSYETTENVDVTVDAPGVLSNDSDPDGDTLSAIWVTLPSHGTIERGADGSFLYSPFAGFHGTDSFTYRASDGSLSSAVQTVTIAVKALDILPPTTTSDARASYTGEAEIALHAVDDVTGVASTYYKLDGAAPIVGTSVHVVTTGSHTLRFWSVDRAGNTEAAHSATFTVTSDILPIEGGDRYATAIRTSQAAFPTTATQAVICRGDVWADVSGGSALAGAIDGPLLLTEPDGIRPAVLDELERLGVKHVYILGDEHAVSAAVAGTLEHALGAGNVTRIGGVNRYATAAEVASETVKLLTEQGRYDGKVFLATGQDFPDAIAAAPLAARLHRPIVLTRPDVLSAEASDALAAIGTKGVHVLGSSRAVSVAVESRVASIPGVTSVSRLEGPDRYATAIAIAKYGVSQGLEWNGLAVATGTRFPDALAGGVMQGRFDSVVLLTYPDRLPESVYDVLHEHRAEIGYCRILGDTASVSEAVRVRIHEALQ